MEIIGVERINNIVKAIIVNGKKNVETHNIVYINYGLNLISKSGFCLFLKVLFSKKKLVIHWIGSDVYSLLMNNNKSKIKRKLFFILNKIFTINNWVAAPLLRDELYSIGISSKVVYLPTELVKDVNIFPLTRHYEFITYLPSSNHEFYGSEIIFNFAKKNPDIIIHVVANDGTNMPNFDNVIYHGNVSSDKMDELYINTKGVIRIPIHDALGGTVLEAVVRGRYAIWTYEAEYAYTARSEQELSRAIRSICKLEVPNYTGAKFVKKHYNYELLSKKFINELSKCKGLFEPDRNEIE